MKIVIIVESDHTIKLSDLVTKMPLAECDFKKESYFILDSNNRSKEEQNSAIINIIQNVASDIIK